MVPLASLATEAESHRGDGRRDLTHAQLHLRIGTRVRVRVGGNYDATEWKLACEHAVGQMFSPGRGVEITAVHIVLQRHPASPKYKAGQCRARVHYRSAWLRHQVGIRTAEPKVVDNDSASLERPCRVHNTKTAGKNRGVRGALKVDVGGNISVSENTTDLDKRHHPACAL